MGRPLWADNVEQLLSQRRNGVNSQAELAVRMQMRENTISRAMRGKASPRLSTLEKIAEVLSVPVWRLFVDDQQAALLEEKQKAEDSIKQQESIASKVEQRLLTKLAAMVREETHAEISGVPMPVKKSRPVAVAKPARRRRA